MKKKWYSMKIVVLGFLIVGALSGCGKVTPEKLLQDAMEKSKKASSFAGNMEVKMDMGMAQSGISMNINVGASMDIEAINEPAVYHAKGKLSTEFLGASMDIELYGEENVNEAVNYIYDANTKEWKKSVEKKKDDESNNAILLDFNTFLGAESELKLAEKTERENDKEVYVITTQIDGSSLEETIGFINEMWSDGDGGVDFSKVKADVAIKIYKDSRLPAAVEVEITEPITSADSEEDPAVEITLESLSYSLCFKEYDTVDKIEIPKEALRAKEVLEEDDLMASLGEEETETPENDDTLQMAKDGNYILTNYDRIKEVKIKIPEDYMLDDYSTCNNIALESKDGVIGLDYKLDEFTDYWTEEDLINRFAAQKEDYNSGGGYRNVSYRDVNQVTVGDHTVSYVSLSYDYEDSYHITKYRAWMTLPDDFVVQCDIDEFRDVDEESRIDEKNIIRTAFEGVIIE